MRAKYTVRWADPAKEDLLEITSFIAADDLITARRIIAVVIEKAEILDMSPERGRVVPEFAKYGIDTFRELIFSPWRIVYSISDYDVYIKLVADEHRDLDDLLFRRLMR